MDFVFDPSLVLYLPLYELDGSSFASKDAYGHLCTVTGALWRPNGRSFDGTDDYIKWDSSISTFASLAEGTIIVWFKTDTVTLDGYQTLFGATDQSDSNSEVSLRTYNTGARLMIREGGSWSILTDAIGTLTTTEWFCFAVTVDATGNKAFLQGLQQSFTYSVGDSNTQAFFNTVSDLDAIRLGYKAHSGADKLPFSGLIGEFAIYNRALTPQEIQHNYLATKWRYQ